MTLENELFDIPSEHVQNVYGQFDAYLKKIERTIGVTVVSRDGGVKLIGNEAQVESAKQVLLELLELSRRGSEITEQNVNYALSLAMEKKEGALLEIDSDLICHTISGKAIKPKTLGQKAYVDKIQVERIILTRPAIEAGEKLGFLPGDLQSKVDPYLRPLYDALYQIMGADSFQKNMEKGLIEVAPLAYMRGRTLDNAFIILDEAQNTTQAQMKMFLTRVGFGSKVVITGDETQKDLAPDVKSGLDVAQKVLGKVEGISFCRLTSRDVVRHPLVQKIVTAYEEYEKKTARRKENHDTRSGRRVRS